MNRSLAEHAASRVRPDASWQAMMQAAIREVFQLMVGTDIQPADPPADSPSGGVSAMVGMAGAICGVLRLRCSEQTAVSIATKMLGGHEPGALSDTCDAIGEISNMVAGNFKAKIAGLCDACMLSVPTVVVGEDYDVYSLASPERVEVSMTYEDQPLWVGLEISS